ncbi:DUF6801 domain-containing protein [Actinomyces sp. F1_1611]
MLKPKKSHLAALIGAPLTLVSLGLATILVAAPQASAKTLTQSFDVTCTQPNVNGGDPFVVGAVANIAIPDAVYLGDEVILDVSVDLALPAAVAEAVRGNGYDSLSGSGSVSALVVAPGGEEQVLTVPSYPLPFTTVPDPADAFGMQLQLAFPSYTFAQIGTYDLSVLPNSIQISGVTVESSAGGSWTIGDFSCQTNVGITVDSVEVVDGPGQPDPKPAPTPEPSQPKLPVVAG